MASRSAGLAALTALAKTESAKQRGIAMVSMLLVALVAGLVLSVLACGVALGLFPWFRSGERKPGEYRPDQSTGSAPAVVVTGRRKKRVRAVRSSELPLIGGAAMLVAIFGATIGTGVFLNFSDSQWTVLGILLAAMVGYGFVGFLDDRRKVYHGQGISELAKLLGVLIVSLAAAVALRKLVPSTWFAYAPYSDVPGLGNLLVHTRYVWVIFFILMTATVATSTSLAVDFSDGMDGLSGGLLLSAALSFAIIILSQTDSVNWPSVLILLAMVGAVLGYLPFNWPSSWRAHGQGRGNRRARLIMGDTGALALGGGLALVTVMTRLELLLLYIGGVFVLEGLSALISARILVKFFRKFLYLPRFGPKQDFTHSEFPLPFLATPMHHHFDLLGWDRQRIVYGAWTLGAGLATLGVASSIAPFTWERYLARFLALLLILLVWQTGPWTRSFFIGLATNGDADSQKHARLALYYGFPFKLFGRPLYARRDVVDITADVLTTPAERLGLWQRTSVYDARSVLGYYCFRAGAYQDAVRVWSRIHKNNLEIRPEIRDMLTAARHRIAIEADGDFDAPLGEVPASGLEAPVVTSSDQTIVWPTEAPTGGAAGEHIEQPPEELASTGRDEHPAAEPPPWPPVSASEPRGAPGDPAYALGASSEMPAIPPAEPWWQTPGQTQHGLRTPRLEPANPMLVSDAFGPASWNALGLTDTGRSDGGAPSADTPGLFHDPPGESRGTGGLDGPSPSQHPARDW